MFQETLKKKKNSASELITQFSALVKMNYYQLISLLSNELSAAVVAALAADE